MSISVKLHCPDCGTELGSHRSAGRGSYKDLPSLLCCPSCWKAWDPQPDGRLVNVMSRRTFYRGHKR